MPGLSFVCDFRGDVPQGESDIVTSLDRMLHYDDYEKKVLLSTKFYFVACTKYKEYPLIMFEDEKSLIYLEGKIYGKAHTVIKNELNIVAQWLFEAPTDKKENIVQWLLDTDGDFIVFILNKKSNSVCFLNDALGRLPLYYHRIPAGLIISRELAFIKELTVRLTFDRMGIAQYLLFGYPLATRTLLDKVYRLPSASLIRIDAGQAEVRIARLHDFNFDTTQQWSRTAAENARELVELFSVACKSRANGAGGSLPNSKNVLALSGGFDSRSVAACLHNENVPFYAATRLDAQGTSSADVKMAEQLAKALDLNWTLFHLERPKGVDLLKLLKIKSGLNYLGMAFILPFFRQIRDHYGTEISYFTGDGGDKVLRDLRPVLKLRNIESLTNYVISRNQIISLDKVAALTSLPREDILAEVKAVLASYPESNWGQKYIHFLIAERSFKWLFEGEDRNRAHFWSVTPFYSIKFFKYAMECPREQKNKFALYRCFLLTLSPIASSIAHANWKLPITSNQYLLYLFMRSIIDRIPPAFKKWVRTLAQHCDSDSQHLCLRDQIANCAYLGKYLEGRLLRDMADGSAKSEIWTLLTVTSTIEELECGQSTLSKYYNTEFG